MEVNSSDYYRDEPIIQHIGDPIANAALARQEYESGATKMSALPQIVTLALTTHCYKHKPCVICDRNSRHSSSDSEVDSSIIDAASSLLKTASVVFLHCGGEAMFSSYFDEVIATINPPTRVSFATNGMALSEERADLMLRRDVMGGIVVSMDASTPEVYRVMRPSCDFQTVKKNIRHYIARGKELYGKRAPRVILNMTLCEANIKDAPQLIDLAVELGVVVINLNHLNEGLDHKVETSEGWVWDYRKQSDFKSKEQHDEIMYETYRRALKNSIKIRFEGEPFLSKEKSQHHEKAKSDMNEFSKKLSKSGEMPWASSFHQPLSPRLKPCLKPWQEISIQPNGNVRRCYFHDEEQWTLGNIREMDIMDIWNSSEMIEFRKEFFEKAMSRICYSSTTCVHRGRQ